MIHLLKFLYLLPFNLLIFTLITSSIIPSVHAADGTGTWTQISDMPSSHSNASGIITLNSGKVLITTGTGQNGITSKSELFDPLTRTWSSTGDVNEGRNLYGNAIVKLPDGNIMIAGGEGPGVTDIGSVEIYDPQTESWSFTDPLATPRRYAAIVLENGKVLVTAGANGIPNNDRFLSSTEIYDPATDTWSSSGALNVAREGVIDIVLLKNGKVLLAGGYTLNDKMTNIAEIYDPATGIWSTSQIPVEGGWSGGSMTVLENGKVLLAGGVIGYWTNNTTATNKSWLYDPSNNTWSMTGSMSTNRNGHSSALLADGKVLMIGGGSNQTNIYDPARGTWALSKTTKYPAYNGIASLQNGDVLAIGGDPEGKSAELFTNEPVLPTPTSTPTPTATPTPTPKLPVILIPGIMGSEFEVKETIANSGIKQCLNPLEDYEYNQGDTVWLNQDINILRDNILCGKYLDILKMDENGNEIYPQIGLKNNLVTAKIFEQHIGYYDTIPFFLEKGYMLNKDFFIFPYDWRKDLTDNIFLLDEKINNATTSAGTTKAQIVAHSMGGLIARDFIRDPERAEKVDAIIELGTPHAGTPAFLAHLLYDKCIKHFGVCIINGEKINSLVQNFPGAHQLMPSKLYYELYFRPQDYPFKDSRDIDGNGVKDALNYDQANILLSNLGKNMNLINKAELYHDSLDTTYGNTNGVKTYIIAGSGQPTIGQIHDYYGFTLWNNRLELPFGEPKLDADAINGDDTVPILSATLGKLSNVFYVNQGHNSLPTGTAMSLAYNLLTAQSTDIPGVSTIPFAFSGQIISVHSPVLLHAYDSEGRHTGPRDDGTIELGIPGSSYDYLRDSKFIYLPEGENYNIKTKATDEGSFDLKIKKYSESALTKEHIFLAIPQTDETTSFMVLNTDTPELQVDKDNNGTVDLTLTSSSTLTGDDLTDTQAPVTTAALNGSQGANDWHTSDVTLSFTGEDSGAGILKTYYYKDTDQVLHDADAPITINTEGITKLRYFSIDRAGNMEESKEITIKIDKTAPELIMQFDPQTKKLVGSGEDIHSGIENVNQTQTDLTVTDKAGNTSQFSFTSKTATVLKITTQTMTITELKYNDITTTIPKSSIAVAWTAGSTNEIKYLLQTYLISKQEGIIALYNAEKSKTTSIEKTVGSNVTKTTAPDMSIIKLKCINGSVKLSY